MPEHVHLLISERTECTPSLVLKELKQSVSRKLRRQNADERRFWEPRFYDFNVHSAGKRQGKLDYMHLNPVKRGLAKHPRDWKWSSFLSYVRVGAGLIPIDYVS